MATWWPICFVAKWRLPTIYTAGTITDDYGRSLVLASRYILALLHASHQPRAHHPQLCTIHLSATATLSERFPAPKPQKINQHGFRDDRRNWKRHGNDAGGVMHTDDDRVPVDEGEPGPGRQRWSDGVGVVHGAGGSPAGGTLNHIGVDGIALERSF